MYCCTDCKKQFSNLKECYETHGLQFPPYERYLLCPECGGHVVPISREYCRCCGARLPENVHEYCNKACRRRGERLWKMQARKRVLIENNPINLLVRMVEEYNRTHGTDYSYGKYVALVLPGMV